jgi:hypothetical protein
MSYNIKFEDRTLRGLRVPDGKDRQEWSDTVVPGLRFRRSDKGHGSFSVVYRVKGQDKQDRRTIGPFPRVSIAQAREEARQDLNAASSGRDPKKLRMAPPEPEARPMTFAELFELYLDRHARENIATWADVERKVRKDALPIIGQMPAGEVRKRHLHLVIDRLVTGGHAVSACGLLYVISAIYTWAEGRELVEYNPVRRFPYPKPAAPPQRRSLTDDQLRALWFALLEIADQPVPDKQEERRNGRFTTTRDLFALVVLTRLLLGQRTTETVGMRRQDLEAQWWNLPGYIGRRRYTKTGRDHRVPLLPLWSEYVLPRVERLSAGRPYVFPSDRLQNQHINAESITAFCSQVSAKVGFPFVARNLRTTFLTSMARLGVPQEVRRRLVNHSDGSVETIHYNLYDYDAEKWAAALRWDAHLRSIFYGETARAETSQAA